MSTDQLTSPATTPSSTAGSVRGLVPVLAVAGLAWTAGQGLLPDMGLEWSERLASVSAATGRQGAATVLLLLAGCLLVVASGLLGRAHLSRLGAVGAVLLGLGGVWLCAGRAAFNLQVLKATELEPQAGVAALEASTGPAFAAFLPTLLALLVGPVLLALAARRSRGASWLPLVLWVVGIVLFIATEFTVKPLEVVGIAVASTGLVLAGRALTRP